MILLKNERDVTYGVSDGLAFTLPPGADPDDLSAESLRRARAEVLPCRDLTEVRLHADARRTVKLLVKGRPGDLKVMFVDTYDEEAQREFVEAVTAEMRPTTEAESSSLRTDLLAPLLVGGVLAVIGGVVISDALAMDDGTFETGGRAGKARRNAALFAKVAATLGTTGSVVVFGGLVLLCVVWAVVVVRGRHPVTRWRLR